jgi:uncharacterized protein
MGKLFNAYVESYKMDSENWQNFLEVAGDIYNSPQLQKLENFEQHLKINRLQHIRSVAFLSFLVSRKLGLNYKETARAATMHDLFYYDWHENDLSHKLHGLRHPKFALNNAFYLCGTLTKREQDIIKRHMWPLTLIPPKYPESYVVTMMDKYCAAIEMAYSMNKNCRQKLDKILGLGE